MKKMTADAIQPLETQVLDRRPQLADVMIAIATVAFALFVDLPGAIDVLEYHVGSTIDLSGGIAPLDAWWWYRLTGVLFGFFGLADALAIDLFDLLPRLLLPASLCLLFMRLLHPRPDRRALFTQPGWLASLAVIVGVLLIPSAEFYFLVDLPQITPSLMVALAWLALSASGNWRPERSWLGRAGRLVGALWIAVMPIFLYVEFWMY
jgi:hypothetical protein